MKPDYALVILAFLVGGFAGFGVSVRMVRKGYEHRFETLIEENTQLSAKSRRVIDKNEELINQLETNLDTSLRYHRDEKPSLRELSRKYQDPSFDNHFSEREAPTDDDPPDAPYEITEDQYQSNYAFAAEDELTYYQGDGVLTDISDEPVPDPVGIVGEAVLEVLLTTSNDTVYVHNAAQEVNYEIMIEHGKSYRHDLIDDEDN